MSGDPCDLSVAEAGAALRRGTLGAVDLAQAHLARIAALDPGLNCFHAVTDGRALADARRADAELRDGLDRGPMHGIPYGLKDIIDVAGMATTCNSRLRLDHVASADSAVARRLRAAGGVLLGKMATSEFACGGASLDPPYPPTRNPHDPRRYAGGSSSGGAGAIGAGMLRVAVGSDTGGSIRVPAAYCGVVGLKPSHGLVSTRGSFPLAPSLDHLGPMGRNVGDTARLLNAMVAKPHRIDLQRLNRGISGLRLGFARSLLREAGVVQELADRIGDTLAVAERMGATVEDITLPDYEMIRGCARVVIAVESHAVHARNLRERKPLYGRTTYGRLMAGAAVESGEVAWARQVRVRLRAALDELLRRCDAIVLSTARGEAPVLNWGSAALVPHSGGSPTVIASLTGHPALSLPIAWSAAGLPLAMQIVGRADDDATVLRIAFAIEDAVGFSACRRPADVSLDR